MYDGIYGTVIFAPFFVLKVYKKAYLFLDRDNSSFPAMSEHHLCKLQ